MKISLALALFIVSGGLAGCVPASRAQTPAGVELEDLTWTELSAQIKSGRTTIILPVGGVEQSGPFVALGKHDARVKVLAQRIAGNLGNALVAPVVAYVPEGGIDPPTEHMRFPGTITVPPAVFRQTLASAAESFRLAGFKDIVLIGDHGGYQADLKAVAEELDRRWAASPARVHYISAYYDATQTTYVRALTARGYTPAEIGVHAGLADTALTLATNPQMVRRDRLAPAGLAAGVHGDPSRASAQLGDLGVHAIVSETTDAIRAAVARH